MVAETNKNQNLLDDDLYLGLRQPRARGKEYDEFVDRFIQAARRRFPKAYIHLSALPLFPGSVERLTVCSEDFGAQNAKRILDKYSSQIPCFNDDIQGTGCVTLAALMAGLHISKVRLKDVRVVCFGTGTAGIGIVNRISAAIATESQKAKTEVITDQIWYVNS